MSEIKECYGYAVQHAPALHRERRGFLRSALHELALLCSDQPGLLGPKALFVFMGLCFSRDEVVWLVQHHENPPIRLGAWMDGSLISLVQEHPWHLFSSSREGKQKAQEDLVDRYLPELLFHMEEIRALVRKYAQVIQR